MKAKDFIEKFVKKEHQGKASILGLMDDGHWYHIHLEEEIPKDHRPVIDIKEGG